MTEKLRTQLIDDCFTFMNRGLKLKTLEQEAKRKKRAKKYCKEHNLDLACVYKIKGWKEK